MRLWHYTLIPLLPRQQLLGQHRECCALRGNGWTKKHSTVQYALDAPYEHLVCYHWQVIDEMISRGYNIEGKWDSARYRGKSCEPWVEGKLDMPLYTAFHYPEHDDKYLLECKENLRMKGITL